MKPCSGSHYVYNLCGVLPVGWPASVPTGPQQCSNSLCLCIWCTGRIWQTRTTATSVMWQRGWDIPSRNCEFSFNILKETYNKLISFLKYRTSPSRKHQILNTGIWFSKLEKLFSNLMHDILICSAILMYPFL